LGVQSYSQNLAGLVPVPTLPSFSLRSDDQYDIAAGTNAQK
jgi:hypothetical protein